MIKNKNDKHRGGNCMKKFFKNLKKDTIEIRK